VIVDRLDARGAKANPDVVLAGDLRLGYVCRLEHLGSADSCHQHRAH
jgi:hypothetical protein